MSLTQRQYSCLSLGEYPCSQPSAGLGTPIQELAQGDQVGCLSHQEGAKIEGHPSCSSFSGVALGLLGYRSILGTLT